MPINMQIATFSIPINDTQMRDGRFLSQNIIKKE